MRRPIAWSLVIVVVLACAPITPPSASVSVPSPSITPTEPGLGAGFRYSTYGPPYDPGPAYWVDVGRRMAERFDGARPAAVWIVGNFGGQGTQLTFPGSSADRRINFTPTDKNEAALTAFDDAGFDVWLQVEPGDAPVDGLIDRILDRYGAHPSVVGVGVDVEWYHSDGTPEGEAVSDADATAWVTATRAQDPSYRVFLKHWEASKMPPTYRDGLVFIDDSQELPSLDALVDEFAAWGASFASSPVGFQYGYPADKAWWGELDDPARDIGSAIVDRVPNSEGLFWVDFTVLDVFPPAP